MRILIFALPRTGSKFVSNNIIKYIDDPTYQVDDMFNADFKSQEIELVNNRPRSTGVELKTFDEFYDNRINVIKQIQGTLVVKCHYHSLHTRPDLIERLSEHFDKIIVVHRRDSFGQLLSHAISARINSWLPGEAQELLKSRFVARPITVPVMQWIEMIEELKKCKRMEFENATEVFVEDLYNSSDEEFCKLLGLPHKEFGIKNDTKEFGDGKKLMVQNQHMLRVIYDRRMTKG